MQQNNNLDIALQSLPEESLISALLLDKVIWLEIKKRKDILPHYISVDICGYMNPLCKYAFFCEKDDNLRDEREKEWKDCDNCPLVGKWGMKDKIDYCFSKNSSYYHAINSLHLLLNVERKNRFTEEEKDNIKKNCDFFIDTIIKNIDERLKDYYVEGEKDATVSF